MPKVLSLVWYKVYPPSFGGQKGVALFNRQLAKHCELVCLCSDNNEPREPYTVLPALPGGQRHVINPFYWQKVKRICCAEKPSAIILEHPYQGISAWIAARTIKAKLVVHSHNIESSRFRQIGKWWWPVLRVYEKWVHRRADLSLFKTEEDLRWAIKYFGLDEEKCVVIPYGTEQTGRQRIADNFVREKYAIRPEEKIFLFAGTLDYEPNAAAVENIFRELAPRLKASGIPFKILICGRNRFPSFQYLNDLSDQDIIMAGEVEHIEPIFTAADVFINPVLYSGGIQTKNIDAIANGCNTVCFASQSTGIPIEVCGNKLFVAADNNWDDFAGQVSNAAAFRHPTPLSFFQYFDWERILQSLIRKLHLHG
ncbi:glycosyltransferase family 4 protein [Terrimonas sp. NA20]|uniref:Glycosyltransferase family 4 protein n=1 Tax=Terrimonas ginsenosidimutans TaxID=2908004 RepID=A0ABS9KSU8_9BACT|nr:glycosyltransferase family 4 protein [Terrimonas ginsenosidimutans]MCG2615393.1 glycosyltransferase family 4 protein [Terrimonas ginsenosidimutans]